MDKDYPTRDDKTSADLCMHRVFPWECVPCLIIMINGLRHEIAQLERVADPLEHDIQTCGVGLPNCQHCKDQMSEWW